MDKIFGYIRIFLIQPTQFKCTYKYKYMCICADERLDFQLLTIWLHDQHDYLFSKKVSIHLVSS